MQNYLAGLKIWLSIVFSIPKTEHVYHLFFHLKHMRDKEQQFSVQRKCNQHTCEECKIDKDYHQILADEYAALVGPM